MQRLLRSLLGCHSGRQVHRGQRVRAHPAAADAAQSSAVGTVAGPRAQEALVGMPTRVQKVVAERQQVAVPREAAAVEEAASKSGSWTERRRDALRCKGAIIFSPSSVADVGPASPCTHYW